VIFATVGTQLPFERMVHALDDWAGQHTDQPVMLQLGETAYRPRHCKFVAYTQPAEWEQYFAEADLVVSHAGMGTILKSLDRGKPLIIMPRLAALNEHRNDHQVATAARFHGYANIRIVNDGAELAVALDNPPAAVSPADPRACENLNQLVSALRQFVAAEVK
jgi:UDP-N-acetylglucosamine transferase subunit ALG13